jgi:hypothetical protein
MLLLPTLGILPCVWIDIKSHGFDLHGFLLYLASDHFFPEYFAQDGLSDLEAWTSGTCPIFVLQSPSAKWVDYARTTNHMWWKVFGTKAKKPKRERTLRRAGLGVTSVPAEMNYGGGPTLEQDYGFSDEESTRIPSPHIDLSYFDAVRNEPLLEIDGKRYSIAEFFSPCLNEFQHANEIQKALFRFNLSPTDHPCLIFFKDLNDTSIWFVDLNDLLNLRQGELRTAFKKWFAGAEFRALLAEAKYA